MKNNASDTDDKNSVKEIMIEEIEEIEGVKLS